MTSPAAVDPTSHSFMSQRLRLHYVDWGNAGAPPLILLHGGRDHCRNWDWVAKALRPYFHIIAPDLRGHGDSQWSADGSYSMAALVYDLAQLVHQQELAPLSIVGHSLGGNIALRYTGIYPEKVARLVAIEGLGLPPKMAAERAGMSIEQRMQKWIADQRVLSGRMPRRYASVEEALVRMGEENQHLSLERARHLTLHGVTQNEDGSFSWKFDNYVRSIFPNDMNEEELHRLWGRIRCPTLLVNGRESWASNPAEDGCLAHFPNARLAMIEQAGHWVHHDQFETFVAAVKAFLTE